jgi:dihydrofolate synthase/folylpolyglutamate synthase
MHPAVLGGGPGVAGHRAGLDLAAAAAAALAWLLGFSDPERGVGWNPRSPAAPRWKPGRTRALLDLAGAPDRRLRVVTIAGTNGKGSTGALLEAIAIAAGRRVGVFSQPHLHDFRERWRIGGQPIDAAALVAGVDALKPLVEELARRHPEAGQPSTFELTVVLAALAFADTELALFEVGLGGRLDPVNALHPALTVMASIGLDHVHILGGSLAGIARDKAAVMRPGVVALSAVQPPAAERVLARAAEQLSARRAVVAPLALAGPESLGRGQPVVVPEIGAATLSLLGPHQRQNAALAVAAAHELDLPPDAIRPGLARARWPGRLEWVPGRPLPPGEGTPGLSPLPPGEGGRRPGEGVVSTGSPVLLDGAHNPDGARALAAALDELAPGQRYALVFGCARDKDAAGLLRPLLRRAASAWMVAANEARAADPAALAATAGRLGGRAEAAGSVSAGLAAARASRAPLVVVAGSLRVVAEARKEVLT